jgi:hypothetical protein
LAIAPPFYMMPATQCSFMTNIPTVSGGDIALLGSCGQDCWLSDLPVIRGGDESEAEGSLAVIVVSGALVLVEGQLRLLDGDERHPGISPAVTGNGPVHGSNVARKLSGELRMGGCSVAKTFQKLIANRAKWHRGKCS